MRKQQIEQKDTEWLTVDEVCKLIKSSHGTVLKAIHKGELNFVKIGRSYRLPKNDLFRNKKGLHWKKLAQA